MECHNICHDLKIIDLINEYLEVIDGFQFFAKNLVQFCILRVKFYMIVFIVFILDSIPLLPPYLPL